MRVGSLDLLEVKVPRTYSTTGSFHYEGGEVTQYCTLVCLFLYAGKSMLPKSVSLPRAGSRLEGLFP
jgi:hypothetical protein